MTLRRFTRLRQYVLAAALGVVAVSGVSVFRSRFKCTSVCGDCGEMQSATEWQIPFTENAYWTTQSSSATISVVTKRYGVVPPHSHRWLFNQGSGNGVMCVLGEGSRIVGAVRPYYADFLACACRCNDQQFAKAWLTLLLDPARSNDARLAIPDLPSGGFHTRQQFEQ